MTCGPTSVPSLSEPQGRAETALLDVRNLSVRFSTRRGTVRAVNGLSFRLWRGETLAIVGESGSGKTVSTLAVMRLLPRRAAQIEGQVLLDGANTLEMTRRELRAIRGREVGMIFQDPMSSLNPVLTVERQLTEIITEHDDVGRREARRRAIDLLQLVGIPSARRRIKDYPYQFSGGMRQRVMIAIALACDPCLIIADEPTTALDVTIQAQVLELIRRAVQEREAALILITHDLGVVAGMCRRVMVMYGGIVVEASATEELYSSPRHPYTAALLGSIPRLDDAGTGRLVAIKGQPPDASRLPKGCPFAARCPRVQKDCLESVPPLLPVHDGQDAPEVACFHPLEPRAGVRDAL